MLFIPKQDLVCGIVYSYFTFFALFFKSGTYFILPSGLLLFLAVVKGLAICCHTVQSVGKEIQY